MSAYVILDLEMCTIPKSVRINKKLRLKNEIIQIGAVMMNESFEVIDQFVSYVKPQFGYVDSIIKKLTGISPFDLSDAPNVSEVLEMFAEWLPQNAVLVTWSENDINQIDNEMWCKNIDIPKLYEYFTTYMDCQEIFSTKLHTTKRYRLTDALCIAGLDYDDTNIHTALCDASNTALLFSKTQIEEIFVLSPYYVMPNYQVAISY